MIDKKRKKYTKQIKIYNFIFNSIMTILIPQYKFKDN